MDLLAVMTEVTDRAGTIEGLRPFPTPPKSAPSPFVCCGAPQGSTLRVTMNTLGNGLKRLTLPVMVAVGGSSDRNVWADMLAYVSDDGPRSVINALEVPDEYEAFDTLAVLGYELSEVTMQDVTLLAVSFNVDITGR